MLSRLAGPQATLRDDQTAAITALTGAGARVLVVQATGWGKSVVYFGATAVRRADGAGPTLVVSPLLSLMRDQVAAATRAGLRAVTLNSANVEDWAGIEAGLAAGEVDLLLVSPERLANPAFGRRVLDGLAGRLGLLVIDECHCLSDWGHDFRPDYRRVADLLLTLDAAVPVLMTTATANARVCDDLAAILGRASVVLRGPLARASLTLAAIDRLTPLDRYAWCVDNIARLPGSGIVYTLTVADADRLAGVLVDAGVNVATYTGRMAAEERAGVEDALRANAVKAVVATSALGMGFDKPDLGFVVHVGAPPSAVAYYQQVGRAGRGIDHAVVVLLASAADEPLWEHYITATVPVPAQVEALLGVLPGPGDVPATVPALEALSGLRRGKVELLLKQLAVDGAVAREPTGWRSTGTAWTFDAARYDALVAARRQESEVMRGYARGAGCLMATLQRALDDVPRACGRCSVCTGSLPDGLPTCPAPATTARVGAALRGRTIRVEPRKMWPGGPFGTRGRIAAPDLAETGRALAFGEAPEWSALLAEAFGASLAGAGPLPAALATTTVAVLREWREEWQAGPGRPALVVALPAAGYAGLTGALADHIGAVGRLPVAQVRACGGPPEGEHAAGSEAAAWWAVLEPAVAVIGDVPALPVLLVVDRTSTLWPVTIAAALLRRAGATAVWPLVVHRLP